ncbi:hypothetical protein FB451DRAFT_1416487 [Mycena latifolia]|nr:hypothetical protein FB451DRAFT_1416487 [Mycena latifolia]
MTGDVSARLSATPLRRCLNILEHAAASRSFTSADSSTRNDDKETDWGPAYPVLLALAPPVGNWLTGGDHLKDALLLLLLVFYLHQLIEGVSFTFNSILILMDIGTQCPGASTTPRALAPLLPRRRARHGLAPRTRAPPPPPVPRRAPAWRAPPPRAPLSSSASASGSAEPLSWFSRTLFALLASLRPLRGLVTRVAARTCALYLHSPLCDLFLLGTGGCGGGGAA